MTRVRYAAADIESDLPEELLIRSLDLLSRDKKYMLQFAEWAGKKAIADLKKDLEKSV